MSYDYNKPIKNFVRKEYVWRPRTEALAIDASFHAYLSAIDKRLIGYWSDGLMDSDIAEKLEVSEGYVTSALSKIWKKIHWHEEHGFKFISHRAAVWLKRRKITGTRSLLSAIRQGFRWDSGAVRPWEWFEILRAYGVNAEPYIKEWAWTKVCKDVKESNAKIGCCPDLRSLGELELQRDKMAKKNGVRIRK